jgi:uncharacterized NAD(P)/FAD-binding protein YdhS
MSKRVAVIGGGAAGATLVSELLARRTPRPLHLDWYTGSAHPFARGVAYGTSSERHLLNVRAAAMGISAAQPQGFLDYAQGIDAKVAGADFLPRRMYGNYVESEVRRAIDDARARGHVVNMVPVAVDAVVPDADGVDIFVSEASSRVDRAVLCVGSLPPRPIPGVDPAAIAHGHYVVDPWSYLAAAQQSDEPREVMLIGMGLTAVDVLLDLAALWPNARFTAVSRHGHTPEVHPVKAAAPADSGAELVEEMREEPAARAWMRHIREAAGQGEDWRPVIDSLRPHTQALWHELPMDERARFLRHARWAWERARHRMPPQVAASVDALERAGRLTRMRGRLRHVTLRTDGRLDVDLHLIDGADGMRVADLVVQTVGLNTDVQRGDHPLLRQLCDNGHVRADVLGLGLDADTTFGVLDAAGNASSRLFAMGTLLRGLLWETTAMPEIRQQARLLADRLIT